ncbi:MAG: arginine repressor [Acidobacteriia bacterium]|nr:arginine repressor [Terriglobia bacterium]
MRSTPKALRHHRILELVSSEPMVTQEEMVRRLTRQGLKVTQATLSRDIKELGLVKSADGYAAPSTIADAVPTPSLSHLLREFVVDVREAQNLLVLKTPPGSAQPVARAIDAESWPELVGTIAGDDTIVVISSDTKSRRQLGKRIRELMA